MFFCRTCCRECVYRDSPSVVNPRIVKTEYSRHTLNFTVKRQSESQLHGAARLAVKFEYSVNGVKKSPSGTIA